jgi:hypothetical protein
MGWDYATNGPIVHFLGDNVSTESHGDDDDDAGWELFLTCPPELWQSYQ